MLMLMSFWGSLLTRTEWSFIYWPPIPSGTLMLWSHGVGSAARVLVSQEAKPRIHSGGKKGNCNICHSSFAGLEQSLPS